MYYKDGMILTTSRGGKNYNVATKHLRENPIIQAIFKQSPNLILDGELYKHDSEWPLQRISGTARLQEWKPECGELEYWIYDYIDLKAPFSERVKILNGLKELFPEDSKIKIVQHTLLAGYLTIKKEHDRYVREGFEGLCARVPDKEYGVNKRSAQYLIKLKEYQDDEFEVIGVNSGLRPEDMTFQLKTKEGKEFGAKPMGDVKTRIYYLEHPNEFIGKFATCKFFYYSQDNVPLQPILKHFRPSDE